jgi:PilZ domain
VLPSAKAVRLLSELLEFDQLVRARRQPLTLVQKQRRQAIAAELHRWALDRQKAQSTGAEARRDPRAAVRLRIQMLGGPRPIDLDADSLAVGGLRCFVNFQPRVGDVLALRMVPLEEPAVEVMARVVWYEPVRSKAGLSFLGLSDSARAFVERVVYSDLVKTK